MKQLLNILRPLITVLLVFQVSVAYALPEGIHLNLCFGPDGQVEISPDLCTYDLPGQQIDTAELFISSDNSHNDCLEFELGCISAGVLRPISSIKSPDKNKVAKSSANATGSPIFLHTTWSLPPTDPARPVITAKFYPYSQISSLRTIVLQI